MRAGKMLLCCVVALSLVTLAACGSDDKGRKDGTNVESTTDDKKGSDRTDSKGEGAVEDVEDAVKDAGDAIVDGAEDIGNDVESGVEGTENGAGGTTKSGAGNGGGTGGGTGTSGGTGGGGV